MARKIDPAVESILKGLKLDPKDVLWDCHGTWCMYHRAIERVAADLGIKFEAPVVMQNDAATKSVAICVSGYTKDGRQEWSIGEAAPGNNKNAYPWAMAEKRAKDRVVLKLVGLHGLIYSEDEMERGPTTPATNAVLDSEAIATDLKNEIAAIDSRVVLKNWGMNHALKIGELFPADADRVRLAYTTRQNELKEKEVA